MLHLAVSQHGMDKADEEEILNMKTVLSGFVDFTTSHGITHIYKTKGMDRAMFTVKRFIIDLAIGYTL